MLRQMRLPLVKELLLCGLSAILLILSFPNANLWLLAWFGFVPLFFSLNNKSLKQAFALFFIAGVIFWSGVIYWLVHVTLPGTIVLILYLALYFGIFGLIIRPFTRNSNRYTLILIPVIWVCLEYLRGKLFTGFPWALLGYSQYLNLWVIQIADITGVWGVSFLVMLVNVLLVEIIWAAKNKLKPRFKKAVLSLVLILALILLYGYYRLRPEPVAAASAPLKVCVIQGNIQQDLKWVPENNGYIIKKYLYLSSRALKEKPDLIIWPEAALPAVLEDEPQYYQKVCDFSKSMHTPLLFGAVTRRGGLYYNSALLLSGKGELLGRYDKLHLVPFGEYVPLKNIFSFLQTIAPIGDIAAGREYAIFEVPSHKPKVSLATLICFEDLFPELSREFVKNGAQILVNITNDAWYMHTSAPYQHLQASVLRAVENRRPLVRSANTGISGFIAPTGKIISLVRDKAGREIFSDGFLTRDIKIGRHQLSFYTRFGDVFIFICVLLILYVIIAARKGVR